MQNKVLILGSKGMLGGQLMQVFGESAVGWDREECDVTNLQDCAKRIEDFGSNLPAVINCVAYNDVDSAEEKSALAYLLNTEVPKNLSIICKQLNILLIHFSSNYIFGEGKGEYVENDLPKPQSIYGESKHQGELEIIKNTDKYYIIRTSVLFGPKGESELAKKSFVELMIELSQKQSKLKIVSDEINSLTYASDLAIQTKKILDDKMPFGVYHIVNSGQASWFGFAKEIFKIVGKKIVLEPVPSSDFKRFAKRPSKSVLLNTKLPALRAWQEALREFLMNSL